MRIFTFGFLSVVGFLAPLLAGGETYTVCPDTTGDFLTVQEGIDDPSVVNGDILQLCPGTYVGEGNRDISYGGKAITVRGDPDHPELYVVDCQSSGRGFVFGPGDGPGSVLEGLTITHGSDPWGGAMSFASCSPTITDCVITENTSTGYGGGLACVVNGNPTIRRCVISYNTCDGSGGGISCMEGAWPTVIECTIYGNTAGAWGGSIDCNTGCSPTITKCTFCGNSGAWGGGVSCMAVSSPTIECSIIALSTLGEGVYCSGDDCQPELFCSDVFGNAGGDWVGCIADQAADPGNICEDPLFCDPGVGDFRISSESPCMHPLPLTCLVSCDEFMGSWAVGCGNAAVAEQQATSSTWGAVKSLCR